MAEKLDPFDVAALEKSVNDSATRVSTIWVSFLVFGLYLVIAAGNVTHRQLFLEEPIKLPVLNIDLPLVGFFFLAPILFVVLHAYVLIQVVLLSRTAAAYTDALNHANLAASDDNLVRQRLANTLFAQVFAGSRREREGVLGWLLQLMAWMTLAIIPVVVLLVFQLKFLSYHSHVVTWTHRILVVANLVTVWLLWSMAINPYYNHPWQSFAKGRRRLRAAALLASFGLAVLSMLAVTFPGEPHANWTRIAVEPPESMLYWPSECHAQSIFSTSLPSNFDRLSLPREDFVDDENLAKLENTGKKKNLRPFSGERTRNFRGREFSCSNLEGADLRRADFTGSILRGANFFEAELHGTVLDGADLRAAILAGALLEGASLQEAELHGANLGNAQLHGAVLIGTKLYDANLRGAKLWGANLSSAELQGAQMDDAELQGVYAHAARFHGASLARAKLHGVGFFKVQLQGAELTSAELQGALLSEPQLQGTRFDETELQYANISKALLWRTGGARCERAQVSLSKFEALFEIEEDRQVSATPEFIESFVQKTFRDVPDETRREELRHKMRSRLSAQAAESSSDQIEQIWRICENNALHEDEYQKKIVAHLVETACLDRLNQSYIATGIFRNWTYWETLSKPSSRLLARGLLGVGGRPCPGANGLDDSLKIHLHELAGDR